MAQRPRDKQFRFVPLACETYAGMVHLLKSSLSLCVTSRLTP
eukprot:SAG11_NODE_23768_length_383_cov_1.077465_1_plen_41_part_01